MNFVLQDGASKIFALKPENLETEIERHARLGVEFSVEVTSDVLLARTVARGRDLLTEFADFADKSFYERGKTSLGYIEQIEKMLGPRGIRSADEDVLLRSMALNILEVRLRTLVLLPPRGVGYFTSNSPPLTFYLRLSTLSRSLPAASYSSRWQA